MSVELHINHVRADAPVGVSLFEVADTIGVHVPTSCLRQGKCRECLVEVSAGMERLTERTEREAHLRGDFRLACQARVRAGSGVVRCDTLNRGEMRIEKQAFHLPVDRGDWELAPAVTRDSGRVLVDGIEVDRSDGPIHGLAIDLGTTTVVVRLLDLETGEIVADASFENPQRFGGSDVMSRIRFDTDHGGRLLQRTVAGYIKHAVEEFPVDPLSIFEVVVVGNSTMRDLFFRQDVYSIGQDPYRSITELEVAAGTRTTTSLTASARRLGLPFHPSARVYGLPIISGHVGADAAAAMLAVNLAQEDRLVAVMDIGTNTELVVGNRHRILAASCPAGPAFEGGLVTSGMPGLPGAIEKVTIDDEGRIRFEVIGGGPPLGICGSGLVDLMGELVRCGRMTTMGRFVLDGDRSSIMVFEDGERTVEFTERDVGELAQAKGANVAGLRIVLKHYGLEMEDLDVFYLAGGFGRHLDVTSSRRIGLIPNIDASKILQVGNIAIEGACIALLSVTRRRELEDMVGRVEHCRLETDPGFFDHFVEGCQFVPVETERGDGPRASWRDSAGC